MGESLLVALLLMVPGPQNGTGEQRTEMPAVENRIVEDGAVVAGLMALEVPEAVVPAQLVVAEQGEGSEAKAE